MNLLVKSLITDAARRMALQLRGASVDIQQNVQVYSCNQDVNVDVPSHVQMSQFTKWL